MEIHGYLYSVSLKVMEYIKYTNIFFFKCISWGISNNICQKCLSIIFIELHMYAL